ncbi:5-oxoprolinase [Dissostichus eleginoides]|uniref:5-oxoprolinase n=1 Tax=Dissostichus eleginoides TaxID=100907 RepID=A0AAD9BMN8_DISEL|nr:5-oxoprolinase [Dissostichus eleginoides]
MWSSLSLMLTHTSIHTHMANRKALSCASESPDGPSVAPRPSVEPTDRQPNSPNTSWQAAPLEDQMLIATRSCRSAAAHTAPSLCLIERQTSRKVLEML